MREERVVAFGTKESGESNEKTDFFSTEYVYNQILSDIMLKTKQTIC
jgi:hypothetical protein